MFTLRASGKKWPSEPRLLFSVSRSSKVNGAPFLAYHSTSKLVKAVLPTPPLPPWVKTIRLVVKSVDDWHVGQFDLFCCVHLLVLYGSVNS